MGVDVRCPRVAGGPEGSRGDAVAAGEGETGLGAPLAKGRPVAAAGAPPHGLEHLHCDFIIVLVDLRPNPRCRHGFVHVRSTCRAMLNCVLLRCAARLELFPHCLAAKMCRFEAFK